MLSLMPKAKRNTQSEAAFSNQLTGPSDDPAHQHLVALEFPDAVGETVDHLAARPGHEPELAGDGLHDLAPTVARVQSTPPCRRTRR